MKSIARIAPMCVLAGSASAHIAELSPAEHASEHGWLLLALIPLLAMLLPLLRRRH